MTKKFKITLKGEVSVPVSVKITLDASSEAEANKIAQVLEANPEKISEYYNNSEKYKVDSDADVDSLNEILHYYGKDGHYERLSHEETEEGY